MKNLKELKGVKVISKTEQKAIAGGIVRGIPCNEFTTCPPGTCCSNNPGYCVTDKPGNCW
jgi:hypothetical protein